MFHGSIVALITPFGEDHGIDIDALSGLVSFHVEAGTSALVVAGTTGESATLEEGEFERLVSEAVRCADGEIPIRPERRMRLEYSTAESETCACGSSPHWLSTAGSSGSHRSQLERRWPNMSNGGSGDVSLERRRRW
jgi:hypothetical protein